MENITKKCKRCNFEYDLDTFSKNDKVLKTCLNCRVAGNTHKKLIYLNTQNNPIIVGDVMKFLV
jgi:hypothetical protein